MKNIIIIGGGPAGIFCSFAVKENYPDCNVTILERLEKIGKKVLATGNGKCNFTNVFVNASKYNNPKFVTPLLEKYDYEFMKNYFLNLGLVSKEISEGRVYPYAENASSVLDCLRLRINKLGINVKCGFDVLKIVFKNGKYLIYNKSQRNYFIEADYIVFATGGQAAPILGSNGTGFSLLKPFKVKIADPTPGLVGLLSEEQICKILSGLRMKGHVCLYLKKTKKEVWSEDGEIQFKNEGLSGIVIMQASSYIARNPGNYVLKIDFMKDIPGDKLYKMLESRKKMFTGLESNFLLTGMFPKMLNSVLIKKSGINLNGYVDDLTKQNLIKLVNNIKFFELPILGTYGFDKAQVTCGGISLDEIDIDTYRIKKMKNAFACGEVLNIDGECGGYNLHFAFASGYCVGTSLALGVMSDDQNK